MKWLNLSPTMVGRRRKFLRCRCSKIASALILSLFVRVEILHFAHHKFTFLLFRSNYSYFRSNYSLFLHFNDVAHCYSQIAETLVPGWYRALNSTGQTRLPCFNAKKSSNGNKFEQKSSGQCIVFFKLVKLNIHLKKIIHLTKFSSTRNWEQKKKLDLFCKKLSVNQINFSV